MGLEGLSIGALAEVTQMSKSGVFAHFGSREELQISVIREYHARFEEEVFFPAMREPRGLPRLRALFERWVRRVSVELDSGCIYISGAVEFDDRPGPVRDALAEMVRPGTRRWSAPSAGGRRRPPARRHRPDADAVRDPRPDPGAAPRRPLPAQPRRAGPRAHGFERARAALPGARRRVAARLTPARRAG
jgi:AcrR family transcriptional regulator